MLPLTLPQLTEEFFVQVCKERWSETQTLEFKAVLSKGDEDARQEFRKDVCALANADGGDLVFGIGDVNGCANAVLAVAGIAANHEVLRINPDHSRKRHANLDGVVMYPCDDPNGVDSYAQIFRDGCFEIVRNVQYDPQDSDPAPWVVGQWVGDQLRG